ncbi:carbon starvation protein [Nannocystis exedens]|uniref:Carbon starvation protein n=1 Tax=Nannocystis exedens TaxID=54 RepID=A0A1I2ABR5_9BACT|nr:carbon starvation protein A [Nannocystis exedens]PCC69755.1 carbon starvation protein CstA [Nannocystis exedens]SFE41455.1 carbon starvation protein [Nannocystis exedens]
MHALWFMILALAVLAIAYRYYSAFLAAKVLALDDARRTPAHERNDGQNYHPTSRWVLFGHHFAAITGAGPLVGPVLAAQFGFLPGYSWILIGVVLGGAVHDLVMLTASVRRGGRSLAEIARDELGPGVGAVAGVAILFIVVIALAGLGRVVVGALAESAWGVFTIGASIPIALAMGLFIYKVRGGSSQGVREATAVGVLLLLLCVVFGKQVQDSSLGQLLQLSETTITLLIAAYGFVASVLPVWMLLCPRDYLSSYMKIGTIALLVLGIVLVNPVIEMPLVNAVGAGTIAVDGEVFPAVVRGSLFPFVFITIACGAISGFHALIASGTTPKMIDKESDIRPIGYGAMLMEGLVGITALLAATALPPADYFAINTDPKIAVVADAKGGLAPSREALAALDPVMTADDRRRLGLAEGQSATTAADKTLKLSEVLRLSNGSLAALGYHADPGSVHASELSAADFKRLGVKVEDLPTLAEATDEVIAARTGGAVSLAVGMARVFSGLPGMRTLLDYWYHFAIMFEALFILTTIDTGTRVGRFLLQEFLGRFSRKLGDPSWVPGAVLSSLVIVAGWSYFILTGSIATIWPMFGIANQLLASVALAVGTTIVLKEGRRPAYAWVTLGPLLFVGTTTLTAGFRSLAEVYVPMTRDPATATMGVVNTAVTGTLLACVLAIVAMSARKWREILHARAVA